MAKKVFCEVVQMYWKEQPTSTALLAPLDKDKSKSIHLWIIRQLLRYAGGAVLMDQGRQPLQCLTL
jgi:hypothetical protein